MPVQPSAWRYDQFITFLLIHASYADLEFTEPERTAILNKVDHDVFDEINSYYDSLGEYDRLGVIISCKDKFIPDEAAKSKIMDTLTEHFSADGTVSKLEILLIEFLDRLIEV